MTNRQLKWETKPVWWDTVDEVVLQIFYDKDTKTYLSLAQDFEGSVECRRNTMNDAIQACYSLMHVLGY